MNKKEIIQKINDLEVELNTPSKLPVLTTSDKEECSDNYQEHLEEKEYKRDLRTQIKELKALL